MDWRERIDNITFSIRTGDGKDFFPLWKEAESEREYNTSAFNFINVYGTLVDRKKPQSRKFPLVFWFQGADNIDQADEFEASADDPRPWRINHPFYGIVYGQPISIKRVDNSLNITEVTVPFWESIDADYPVINYTVKDNTRDKHNSVYSACSNSYVTNVTFASIDISKNAESIIDMAGEMKVLQDNTTYAEFQNFLNSGLKAIDNLLEEPLNAIQMVQNFLDLPATYVRAIEGRLGSYENIYHHMKDTIKTVADKKYYEAVAGSIIASMALVVVTPIMGDYVLVSDIAGSTLKLVNIYNDYLETLDELKVSIYDVDNNFIPDATVQTELNSLVNFTIANLYAMTFEAKTERIVYADKKTNVILLTHKYLGLDASDENIATFIKTNNIKLNELFAIEKGREIKYAK